MKDWLGPGLRLDWRIGIVTVISMLLMMTDHYVRITTAEPYDRLILYLLVPLLVILLVLRRPPSEYGFGVGDWKAGIVLTGAGIGLATPLVWAAAMLPSMRAYYESQLQGVPWTTFVDLLGWEFLFRGFILFGYARKFGPEAIWLQAVPFAIAHVGKPAIETFSTIFGGFAFGWLAYRTRSFLYPFILHWFVATFAILVAARALK